MVDRKNTSEQQNIKHTSKTEGGSCMIRNSNLPEFAGGNSWSGLIQHLQLALNEVNRNGMESAS